jgi:hypothetical protein
MTSRSIPFSVETGDKVLKKVLTSNKSQATFDGAVTAKVFDMPHK